jgi:DeoR/GlpR family transcriptional regulator of sugar metabolism
MFLVVNGISIVEGLTTPDELEAYVDNEVVKKSKDKIILADNSKFGAAAFLKICSLEVIVTIITDKAPSIEYDDFFKNKNIRVLYNE